MSQSRLGDGMVH